MSAGVRDSNKSDHVKGREIHLANRAGVTDVQVRTVSPYRADILKAGRHRHYFVGCDRCALNRVVVGNIQVLTVAPHTQSPVAAERIHLPSR